MENINQLYLIGMMGSGKSSTGKTLSLILNWDFIDIDNEISRTHNSTINELFLDGEKRFREIEFQELKKHSLRNKTIFAVGGGAVTHQDSYDMLSSKNCIYLKLLNVKNKSEVLNQIMNQREQKYVALSKNEVITDNQSIQDNCNQIMEIING